jgi:glycosyltransferase involved in cell wall biosynthesis
MLLRAMVRIVREEPRAHLLIVGRCDDDSYGGQVRQMVKELGLESAVTFLGVRRDVGVILKACDLGVLSSRSEGLPVALLEYGQAGLSVVCTDVGDCRKVVEGCGVVVPIGDDERMAKEVLALLRDTERRQLLARRLRNRIERFWSRESAVRKLTEYYEAALG